MSTRLMPSTDRPPSDVDDGEDQQDSHQATFHRFGARHGDVQTTLVDFDAPSDSVPETDAPQPRGETVSGWEWSPGNGDQRRCKNCGTPVSKDYVRVFSDDPDNEELQHCYACRSRTERY